MKELFQHAALTEGITVRVAVNFLPEQSRIEAGKWFWVYHIRIENGSDQAVQLLTRHWRITDANGDVAVVEGEGVVGTIAGRAVYDGSLDFAAAQKLADELNG